MAILDHLLLAGLPIVAAAYWLAGPLPADYDPPGIAVPIALVVAVLLTWTIIGSVIAGAAELFKRALHTRRR